LEEYKRHFPKPAVKELTSVDADQAGKKKTLSGTTNGVRIAPISILPQ